jgi:hypothetical protein
MPPPDLLTRTRRSLVLLALLCILVARTAVPAGWMPTTAAGGHIVLAPCSGMGVSALHAAHAMAAMDMPGMTVHASRDAGDDSGRHPDTAGDHPCAGAGVGVALETPALDLAVAPALPPSATLAVRPASAIGHGLAAPPPPATGPPFLA